MMTIKVLELVSGFFLVQMDVPIQVRHMIGVMWRDFKEYNQLQVAMTDNQRGTMRMMSQIEEHYMMNYSRVS